MASENTWRRRRHDIGEDMMSENDGVRRDPSKPRMRNPNGFPDLVASSFIGKMRNSVWFSLAGKAFYC